MVEMNHLGRRKTCFGIVDLNLIRLTVLDLGQNLCLSARNKKKETQDTAGQGRIHDDLNISRRHLPRCHHLLAGDQAGTKSFSHGTLRIQVPIQVWIQTVTHVNVHLSWLQSFTARIALSI